MASQMCALELCEYPPMVRVVPVEQSNYKLLISCSLVQIIVFTGMSRIFAWPVTYLQVIPGILLYFRVSGSCTSNHKKIVAYSD